MDLKDLRNSPELEAEGVWQPAGGDTEILVARWGNPRSTRLFQSLTRPYRRQIDNGTMDPKKQTEILCKVVAQTILLDWKNLREDGVELEYSTDEAFRVLQEYDELLQLVRDYAEDAEAYRERELEESEGN